MYAEPQNKQRFHAGGAIAGGAAIGSTDELVKVHHSPLDGAINRCDSSSQEVSALISVLEERLDRVLAPPTPANATGSGINPDSGVPLIRALDELNHRQSMAAQRLRGLIERLAV